MFIKYDVIYLHIGTDTDIKSPGIRKCRSESTERPAGKPTGLKALVSSLKIRIRDQKRIIREKDKAFADLKWENAQLKRANTRLQKKKERHETEITRLKEQLRIARLPKDSSNSSRPPSTDIYKPKRNKNLSLRERSGKKSGGQPGHKGTTLAFCHDEPDEVIVHSPAVCSECGADLTGIDGEVSQTHQVIDSTVPQRILINHQTLVKKCTCGRCNTGIFPPGARGMVNYGPGIMAVVANLSVRQYIPYARVVEMLEDLYHIHISEGTVANLLKGFEAKCQKPYLLIHDRIKESSVIGADETSVKVDGGKWWMHTYQNGQYTFIGAHPSRGIEAQEQFFPGGFPDSILVTDCLAMQLSTPAAAHQICNPHLLRELKAMKQEYTEEKWPGRMTCLIKDALKRWEKGPTPGDVTQVTNKLTRLLNQNQANAPGKIPAFHKRLVKHSEKVFLYLKYADKSIPPDNNASERAIRNVKVKVKVSGQFKSGGGAHEYAVIRSIIDTANKQGLNIHRELFKIATSTS